MDQNNNNNKFHFTPEGLAELQKEYDELISEKRPRLVERLTNARNMGDLSENNDYITAKEELEFLDGRIDELEQILNGAVIIKKKAKSTIDLGAKVTLSVNGKKHIFHIVGEWEADPQEQKISHESPLGRALLGKKVGEIVEVEAPVGKISYKILDIE
ncbi:transcription elongation factor GreA [Candidatus Microgenomates bacterium]|nr:transcription elongation factor GreA [Candidatus Microgenomates bacterium]